MLFSLLVKALIDTCNDVVDVVVEMCVETQIWNIYFLCIHSRNEELNAFVVATLVAQHNNCLKCLALIYYK